MYRSASSIYDAESRTVYPSSEKSRVVSQSEKERNFHVFYQLLTASGSMPELSLMTAPDSYGYLAAAARSGVRPPPGTFDDAGDWTAMCNALTVIGVPLESQRYE